MKGFFQWLFFGNIFLGLCAVTLSVETCLQLHYVCSKMFLLLAFLTTVFYYNIAYITEKPPESINERSHWYFQHHKMLKNIQRILGMSLFLVAFLFFQKIGVDVLHQQVQTLLFLASFPMAALLYYGIHPRAIPLFRMRDVGWLKPFLIGYSWAGMVTILPSTTWACEHKLSFQMSRSMMLWFGINWLLCSIIAILFDIKDYATDYNNLLQTFVVKKGLRFTLLFVLLPLCVLLSLMIGFWGWTQNFTLWQSLLLQVPVLALIRIAFSLQKRRNIVFYLVVIDGIVLLKALCGILIYSLA